MQCHYQLIVANNASWRQSSGSRLAQVMACCLMTWNRYRNQCWLIIDAVRWHLVAGNFTKTVPDITHYKVLQNDMFGNTFTFPRGQWAYRKHSFLIPAPHMANTVVGIIWYFVVYMHLAATKYHPCDWYSHLCLETWHDDFIKWKHFPRYRPFVQGIHWWPVNSPHKGQWRGALMFSLIYVWINDWVNNREVGDLRRYRAHYDVIVMDSFRLNWYAYIMLPYSSKVVQFCSSYHSQIHRYLSRVYCMTPVVARSSIATMWKCLRKATINKFPTKMNMCHNHICWVSVDADIIFEFYQTYFIYN